MATLTALPDLGGLTGHEAFKYSRLGTLARRDLVPAARVANAHRRLAGVHFPFDVEGAIRLVLVDGCLEPDLSDLESLPAGVQITPFARTPETLESPDHPFQTLHALSMGEGLSLQAAPNTVSKTPIQLVWVQTASQLVQPHLEVSLGSHSEISLIETHVGLTPHRGLSNGAHRVSVAEGAVFHHYKLVVEPDEAAHVASMAVEQQAGSQFHSFYLALGGGLLRNEVRVGFQGEGAECHLNGLYVANGDRQMDNQTVVDHRVPHCRSHQLYRGILDDAANGVFNGRVYVRPDAQKTNAFQTNNNLLLSENASINTKPQLEIDADDVKCSHGATIGRLDDEALFYLRSRGIDLEMAKSLLSVAFASLVVDRIPLAGLRGELNQWLFDRFAATTKEEA